MVTALSNPQIRSVTRRQAVPVPFWSEGDGCRAHLHPAGGRCRTAAAAACCHAQSVSQCRGQVPIVLKSQNQVSFREVCCQVLTIPLCQATSDDNLPPLVARRVEPSCLDNGLRHATRYTTQHWQQCYTLLWIVLLQLRALPACTTLQLLVRLTSNDSDLASSTNAHVLTTIASAVSWSDVMSKPARDRSPSSTSPAAASGSQSVQLGSLR